MRLSRRLTGILLLLVLAGALAPSALAGKRRSPAPPPVVAPTAPLVSVVASEPAFVPLVDIEALR
jgi:hypothetical protein